ncbi:MAG: S26 family signal peptidase [Gammaproteobacteria bacterium]|nr:S26 family signal peptidase [Gammaproteobacteria bacterium]
MTVTALRTVVCVAMGVAVIALPVVMTSSVRLVYNATASAPLGWYVVVPMQEAGVGDVVLAHLPSSAARIADERHYLPESIPILKRVGAVAGQGVCVQNYILRIDRELPVRLLERDGLGRPLTPWRGCRALNSDELFLLSHDSPSSFDSRYFGPIPRRLVIGRAVALWTW